MLPFVKFLDIFFQFVAVYHHGAVFQYLDPGAGAGDAALDEDFVAVVKGDNVAGLQIVILYGNHDLAFV